MTGTGAGGGGGCELTGFGLNVGAAALPILKLGPDNGCVGALGIALTGVG